MSKDNDAPKGGTPVEQAIANQSLVTNVSDNPLAQAALEGQNSGGSGVNNPAVELNAPPPELVAKDLVQGIHPLGEARVDRVQPATSPEWYEVIAERTPAHWGLADQVELACQNGFEISPGQGNAAQIAKLVKVRLRLPWPEYLKRVRDAEIKAESMRRAKTPQASIDKSERTAIDLQELFTVSEGTASDVAQEGRVVAERITGK